MFQVEEFRIHNHEVRKWFMRIPDIKDLMIKQQLDWIQKITRMGDNRAPRKLVASWTSHPRKPGAPQITYRQTYANALQHLFPEINPVEVKSAQWLTRDPRDFNVAMKEWWKEVLEETDSVPRTLQQYRQEFNRSWRDSRQSSNPIRNTANTVTRVSTRTL